MVIVRFFFYSPECQDSVLTTTKVVQDVNKNKENGIHNYLKRKAGEKFSHHTLLKYRVINWL